MKAEEYFGENTELESSFDAKNSEGVSTESEVIVHFAERGFEDCQIIYE